MWGGLAPGLHPQSHASVGGGAFSGTDGLDPIAVYVLFEGWDPQTGTSQDDPAGACLGQMLGGHGPDT